MSALITPVTTLIAALIGSGGLVGLLQWLSSRRGRNSLIEPYTDTVGFLRKELTTTREEAAAGRAETQQLRAEVQGLHDYIDQLLDAMKAAGIPVPPRPAAPRAPRRRRTTS